MTPDPAAPGGQPAGTPQVLVTTPAGEVVGIPSIAPSRPAEGYAGSGRGIGIDLGCGFNKAAGLVGVDVAPGPGVDYVVDFDREPLPFPDDSVEYVYSSNALEHLREPHLVLLNEIPRVCMDRARFEFWIPRTYHNHAHVFGHLFFWNEEPFLHLCCKHRQFWTASTGVSWNLQRLVYVMDPLGFGEITRNGFSPEFAVRHLNNVVVEFGVIGWFGKPGDPDEAAPQTEVVYSTTRAPADYRPLNATGWW